MKSVLRAFLLLPALILALVAIPSVVFSAADGSSASTEFTAGIVDAQRGQANGTVPPGTVPMPPPRPRPRPVPVEPALTAEPARGPRNALFIDDARIMKVIGDQLSSTIYAYTEDGWLYRSNRDGRIWFLVTRQPFVDNFIMNAADPNVLYSGMGLDCIHPAAELVPMYKSVDGGRNWFELPKGVNLRPLLTDQGNPDNLFAADCTTVYLTTNGGQTWTAKPEDTEAQLRKNYVPVAMASASLVGDPRPETPHWDQLYAIGNDPVGMGAVAFTGDLGDSWVNITDPSQQPVGAKVVVAARSNGGQLWVVDNYGVWSTIDYGVNWVFTNEGLPRTLTDGGLNDLVYGYNGKLYLATTQGVYEKSIDGGEWVRLPSDAGFNNTNVTSMLMTNTAPRRLWLNTVLGVFDYAVQ